MTDGRTLAALERAADLEVARHDASFILAHPAKPGTFEHQVQEITKVALARAERLTAKLDRCEAQLRAVGIDPDAA